MDERQRERAALGVHLSVSGQRARILEDGFSEHGYVLEIGGAEQSHVDAADATVVFYEYLRRIANVLDVLAPPREPVTALHLGAGALTLARYVQATRPRFLALMPHPTAVFFAGSTLLFLIFLRAWMRPPTLPTPTTTPSCVSF